MSKKAWGLQAVVLCVAVAVCFFAFSVPSSPAQDKSKEPSRVRWEYKLVTGTPEEKLLNELGEQGWELFKVVGGDPYVEKNGGAGQFNGIEKTPRLHYFKRQK